LNDLFYSLTVLVYTQMVVTAPTPGLTHMGSTEFSGYSVNW